MTNSSPVSLPPAELLACPNCGAGTEAGLDLKGLTCKQCSAEYFSVSQVACLFPAGIHQKALWQHQTGVMQIQGQEGLAHLQEAMSRYDLTDTTRLRLLDIYEASKQSQETTLQLLAQAGIPPQFNEQLAQVDPGDLAEYFDLILRDWAWGDHPSGHFDVSENNAALQRALSVLKPQFAPQRVLVLGAGAGRLSWDLHCRLKPACTVAMDSNPLLLLAAERLIIQQRPLTLAGRATFPQIGKSASDSWELTPPDDPGRLRESWHPVAANAWRAPFKPESFDLIVTPWFIDVNGGDVRDLIGLIAQLLAPRGRWLNSGPLLFTRHLPLYQKYSDVEIKEFLALAGFKFESERVDDTVHLASPLESRAQHEQLWTFCARAPGNPGKGGALDDVTAPWLLMHHLPVPVGLAPNQEHPLIDAILSLIDGQRSINQISHIIAPHLPQGIAAKDAVVTLLGQMLQEGRR